MPRDTSSKTYQIGLAPTLLRRRPAAFEGQ
jgi:hypothetical protein